MVKWKIYYANGTTFSSNDGELTDAPTQGVVTVQYRVLDPNDPATIVSNVSGYDYYYWSPTIGEFQGMDLIGVIDTATDLGIILGTNVGNPTTFETEIGNLDSVGLIMWLSGEKHLVFRGQYVDSETFNSIKNLASTDTEVRQGTEIKNQRYTPPIRG